MKSNSKLPCITPFISPRARKDNFAKAQVERANGRGNFLYLHPLMQTTKFNLIDNTSGDNNKVFNTYSGSIDMTEKRIGNN